MNILIRSDASFKIGTGHILRDIVLAKQFKNDKVFFATLKLDGNLDNYIIENGYEVISLKTSLIDELIGIIKDYNISLLIIDHYEISYNDEKYIKDKTNIKIFVVDDKYKPHYCDILLNHNIHANKSRYKKLVPSWCKIRCGKDYTLLRDEFYYIKKTKKNKNNKFTIFISLGGTDPLNLTYDILLFLEQFDIKVDIVTTNLNKNLEKLQNIVNSIDKYNLHINCNYIAKLIYNANLAIVTPSVIMNEVLFLETNFIAIKTMDNQNEMFNYLKKNNYLVFDSFNNKCKDKIISVIKDYNEFN